MMESIEVVFSQVLVHQEVVVAPDPALSAVARRTAVVIRGRPSVIHPPVDRSAPGVHTLSLSCLGSLTWL